MFGRRPYDEVRIDEIAERVGVPQERQSFFTEIRHGVLAYLRYDEEHPHGAWAAYLGKGGSDPVLRGIEDIDNDRQANRLLDRLSGTSDEIDSKTLRDLRAAIYGWLAFTFEMCRQRLLDSSLGADFVADLCAHALLDAIRRVPGIPAALADAAAADRR